MVSVVPFLHALDDGVECLPIGFKIHHLGNRRPQFFYTTAPLPCPYLAGRTERKIVTELTGPEAEALHDRLSRAGFRRSHNIAYSPVCPGCNACVPIRIRAADLEPNRAQRKLALKAIREAEWAGAAPTVKVSPHATFGKAI